MPRLRRWGAQRGVSGWVGRCMLPGVRGPLGRRRGASCAPTGRDAPNRDSVGDVGHGEGEAGLGRRLRLVLVLALVVTLVGVAVVVALVALVAVVVAVVVAAVVVALAGDPVVVLAPA